MALFFKWLSVPVVFTATLIALLYLWWNYGPPTPVDPVLPAEGVGSIRWLVSSAVTDGLVILIITVLAFAALPSISWRQVGYIAIGTVSMYWIVNTFAMSLGGRETTNGAEVIRTALSYAVVLLVSSIWIRRSRRHSADRQSRPMS